MESTPERKKRKKNIVRLMGIIQGKIETDDSVSKIDDWDLKHIENLMDNINKFLVYNF